MQQDPVGDGVNWYAYAGNNPVVGIDPDGLDLTIPGLSGQAFLVFDEGSGAQLGMSAGATLSGLAAGATLGLWQPDWTDPCDPYAGFSKGMGTMSGAALVAAGGVAAGEGLGVEVNAFSRGNVFKIISRTLKRGFRIDPAHHGKPWGHPHWWKW